MSHRLKPIQTDLAFEPEPDQPREVVVSGDAFLDLCRRANDGELVIESAAVRTPAVWVCQVRPKGEQ